ncbi:MAG TPA: DUF4831 domain-containing protein [Porphyromonadaceae bacterium]|nr:DUF4831 domain-containing protein [Porphyromonadaceae bacterium]
MKIKISIAGLFLCALVATAQTKVEKVVPTKASGDGITYSLPKTSFVVNAEITKITEKAGPYYRYAERYLGVKDVVTEDAVYYELGKITLLNKGVPDPDNMYKIEFRQKTVAPFAYLTSDGLLCAINEVYTPDEQPEEIKSEKSGSSIPPASSVYTEDLLMAGSVARQAEVAAKQIYRLRESRTDILTGDADNLPPDGEAMKIVISKLEDQEKALTKLFTGTEMRETFYYDVSIMPEDELDREVLFRFSSKLGILDDDDLGGEPVYMNLTALERAPELDPKEAEKKEKLLRGVVYNVPGRARVEIIRNNTSVLKKDVPVVQFGTQEVLAPVILEDKKEPVKVVFYPETGAIRQISK